MKSSLLFDLDGTIVETDRLHFAAFNRVFALHGVTVDWTAYKARVMGRNNAEVAADFLPDLSPLDHAAIMERKEAAYREQIASLEAAPGLPALLDWADQESIPCGVVTNAPRVNADSVLAVLGLRPRFKVLVIGPELREAKLHPLPYLTALEALDGDAAHSVGFEDSAPGAASAAAAGLGVVGITSSLDPQRLRTAGAHVSGRDFNDPEIIRFVRTRTGR